MESFNEDADGLFACLLEEPGADQSVNYEVQDNSKNHSQLGGDASFGYDDGYGHENQPQQDDLGGGGGDDGGGMSLGAQFLDLVASTIGDEAGFAQEPPAPKPAPVPSYAPPQRSRPRQHFQQGQIVRPRQGDIVAPKIQPINRIAAPKTKVQKASPNVFIKTNAGGVPKRIIGTPVGAGIKIRRPGVPIAGPGVQKMQKPAFHVNSGPSVNIRPTPKAPSIPSMRDKGVRNMQQARQINRPPPKTTPNDLDGFSVNGNQYQSGPNRVSNQNAPRNQNQNQYSNNQNQPRGAPQNDDQHWNQPLKDNSFSSQPGNQRNNQFERSSSGPNRDNQNSMNQMSQQNRPQNAQRNNQGQFQAGQNFNSQGAKPQIRHPVGQNRPQGQNMGMKQQNQPQNAAQAPQTQSFDDWGSPSPEPAQHQIVNPNQRQRNPTPTSRNPQIGQLGPGGPAQNMNNRRMNQQMPQQQQQKQQQQLSAEQSWDRAMGPINRPSQSPNQQKRPSLPGQNHNNSQQQQRYTSSPMNASSNLGPYESEPISPLTSNQSPYGSSQNQIQNQHMPVGRNQSQIQNPNQQNNNRQPQKAQFRGTPNAMDSNFNPMSPQDQSRMQNPPNSMHQRAPSLGNSVSGISNGNKFQPGGPGQLPAGATQKQNQNLSSQNFPGQHQLPPKQKMAQNQRRQSAENRSNDDLSSFLDFSSFSQDPAQNKQPPKAAPAPMASPMQQQQQAQGLNQQQSTYGSPATGRIPHTSQIPSSLSATGPLQGSSATVGVPPSSMLRTSLSTSLPVSMPQQQFHPSSAPVSTFLPKATNQPIQQTSSMPSSMQNSNMPPDMNRIAQQQPRHSLPQQQQQRQSPAAPVVKNTGQAQPENDNILNDWFSSIMTDNNKAPQQQQQQQSKPGAPAAPVAPVAPPPKPRSSLLNITPNMSKSQAPSSQSLPAAPGFSTTTNMLQNLKQEPIDTSYMSQAARKASIPAASPASMPTAPALPKPTAPVPTPTALGTVPTATGMLAGAISSVPQPYAAHQPSVISNMGASSNPAIPNSSIMQSMLSQPTVPATIPSSKPASVITSLQEKPSVVLTPVDPKKSVITSSNQQQSVKTSSKFGMQKGFHGLINYWGQMPPHPLSAASSIPTSTPMMSKSSQALTSGLQSAMASAAGHPTMTPPNIADLLRMGVPMESFTPQMLNALMGVHRDPYGRPMDNYLGLQAEMSKTMGAIPGAGIPGVLPDQPVGIPEPAGQKPPAVSSGGLMNALSQTISKQNTKDTKAKNILEEVKNQKILEIENKKKKKTFDEAAKNTTKSKSTDDTPIVDLLRAVPGPKKDTSTPVKAPVPAAAPVTPSAFNWKKKMASSASTTAPEIATPTPKSSSVIMSNPNQKNELLNNSTSLSEIIAAELKDKKKKKKRKERIRRKTKDSDEEVTFPQKKSLPPDPGYIPKVRITTFRSLTGSTMHQSHQFKPGDEKPVKSRGRRAKKNLETGSVDLSEMYSWERNFEEKRRKRRRALIGLPEEDELPQKESRLEEPVKEDKPIEPSSIQIEDDKPTPDKENQEFSSLIYSTAPVPRRVLPKPPARLHLDEMMKKTYKCEECNDEFLFEKSLKHHYDRESILIHIHCMVCNLQQVFKNKCQLLRHAREHSLSGKPMKFVRPKIMPLTLSMCQNIKTAPLDKNTKYAKSCSECGKCFATRIGLQEHMSEKLDETECDVCHTVLPNMCAYQAHCRIHNDMGGNTFVCPECGENFGSDELEFRKHIKLHCAHTSKIQGFRCPITRKVFSRAEHLRAHWQNHCLIKFHKCSVCPIAFRGQKSIRNHTQEKHPTSNMLYKSIFQCPFCDTLFEDRDSPNVAKHLMEHTKNHRYTVYHCLVCPEVFEHPSELMEHMLADHNISEYKTPAAELESALEFARTNYLNSKNGNVDNHNKIFTDEELSEEEESLPKSRGRRKERWRARSPDPVPGTARRTYICSICGFSSSVLAKLQKHIKTSHSVSHVTADMIRTKVSQTPALSASQKKETKPPLTGGNVLMTPQGPIPMRNMRKEPTQEELAQEDPPLPDVYKCAKCDFQHSSREVFQRHIKIHLSANSEEKQCTECGQSFASLAALEKHLFMSHKIVSIHQLDRIDRHFREPMAPKSLKSSATFSCKACQKSFNSEVVLKQHEKQHGLHFIKSLK